MQLSGLLRNGEMGDSVAFEIKKRILATVRKRER
jgi:hypothetical protein